MQKRATAEFMSRSPYRNDQSISPISDIYLKNNKSPDSDGIPAELYEYGIHNLDDLIWIIIKKVKRPVPRSLIFKLNSGILVNSTYFRKSKG